MDTRTNDIVGHWRCQPAVRRLARRLTTAAALLAGSTSVGCGADGTSSSGARLTDAVAPAGFVVGPVTGTAPPDNALSEDRATLGRRLFYDPVLSRTRQISCASCHEQSKGFGDAHVVSTGVDGLTGKRNASTLSNLAWADAFFWDGRVATLEEQVVKPIANPVEMDLAVGQAVARLRDDPGYVIEFASAYGEAPTERTLRKALASFVRTLVSGASRYDRFLAGDSSALSDPELRGHQLFFSKKTACFSCHPAGALSESGFFNNGSFVKGGDVGREAVTGRSADRGKFKVPGLRNIAVSGPYMHDGSLTTLEEVVEQYARGGRGDTTTTPQVARLSLTRDEKADLVSFLKALTDEAFLTDSRFAP